MPTPRGAPLLAFGQAIPESTVNEQVLRTEAGAGWYPVADRVTAPPGSCADGATYLIIATATGAFVSKETQLATAVGANAASGWLYRIPGELDEGLIAYVQDEDALYKWSGAAWATYTPGGSTTIQFPVEEEGVEESATVQRLNFTGNVNVSVASNEATIDIPAATTAWELLVAVSDETTALTTGTGKVTFRMPRAVTLTEVRASVTTAPTGSTLIVDINEGGASILSTKLSIDASEKTSTTAATPAVISDTALADDAEITIDIDQVGSTIAGAGLKVLLKGTI